MNHHRIAIACSIASFCALGACGPGLVTSDETVGWLESELVHGRSCDAIETSVRAKGAVAIRKDLQPLLDENGQVTKVKSNFSIYTSYGPLKTCTASVAAWCDENGKLDDYEVSSGCVGPES